MEEGTTTGSLSTPGVVQQAVSISNREKQIVLWLNNINHAMNHFQNHIVFVMYPTIAREMGFVPVRRRLRIEANCTAFRESGRCDRDEIKLP